jgi:hypothetical protein
MTARFHRATFAACGVTALVDAGVDPRKEPYNTGRMASGNKAVQDALKRRPGK